MKLPEPYAEIVEIDRRLSRPVVRFEDLKRRRVVRRHCQVYLLGPTADTPAGGTPIALVRAA